MCVCVRRVPNFDNFVLWAEHGLAHGDDPRVTDELDEAAQLLGMHLDVVAVGPATNGPALPRHRLLEGRHDVLAH
jgi:hypothetical protein